MAQTVSQLTHQLPLLKIGLQRIQKQAELSNVPPDIVAAVLAVIEDTKEHSEHLQQDLHQTVPRSPTSRTEQTLRALRSFRLEKRCKEAIGKIRQNLEILSFYQQAAYSEDLERIRKLIYQVLITKSAEDVGTMQQKLGLVLGTAPVLDPDYFVGREAELADLDRYLSPRANANAQRIVSIVGIGGVGKTQLSLAYARKYAHQFTSIFWLDAGEVSDVRQSMIRIWNLIEGDQSTHLRTEDKKVESLRSWLAEPWNDGWLLIFDNHDNPKTSGHDSCSAYDLRTLLPSRAHGKILITTRSANLTYTKRLELKEVESVDLALELLSQRASRDITKDGAAKELALRLNGLPLALATAGSLLRQTSLSCAEYLDIHNSHWVSLYDTKDSELLDYNRTLASTWMVSADSVAEQDPDALALLKYLAYFSNQDIWYELVAVARQQNAACPAWILRVTANRLCFDRAMQKLVGHSLVDVIPGSYHLHSCLHDWLLARFNDPPDYELFTLATQCIHSHLRYEVGDISVFRTAPSTGRLRAHLRRVRLPCFNALWIMKVREERCPEIICAFTSQECPRTVKSMDDSVRLLGPMLEQSKQAFRDLTHETAALAHQLGLTLLRLHRYQEAKQPLRLALDGFKQILGPGDVCTLHCCWRLGELYNVIGDSSEAEKMFNHPISSVTALLDKDGIVPKSLRNCYLFCLVSRARLANRSSDFSEPCIRELVKIAQITRKMRVV